MSKSTELIIKYIIGLKKSNILKIKRMYVNTLSRRILEMKFLIDLYLTAVQVCCK